MKFHTFHIRWRSSLWKLLWRELLVYTASFLIISCIYRTCLHPEQQIVVEKLIRWGQPGPLSLVEECRGLALVGRELHSVALLCHKEPALIMRLLGALSWFFMA